MCNSLSSKLSAVLYTGKSTEKSNYLRIKECWSNVEKKYDAECMTLLDKKKKENKDANISNKIVACMS
jgi:hypothetical protein